MQQLLPGAGSRLKAVCKIYIGGIGDVTARWRSYLISVETNEKFDATAEGTCSIELDDSYAQLPLPPLQAPIQISMGWVSGGVGEVWSGVIDEVESGCSRKGGGRRLWIDGKTLNYRDGSKTRQEVSEGEGKPPDGSQGQQVPLSTFLQKVAANAGISLQISPSMAAITRDYWWANESFNHVATRIARELGGVFQGWGGNNAILVSLMDGMGIGGAMGGVTAIWGDNLLAWRVKPVLAKPEFGMAASEFFDKDQGAWFKIWQGLGGVIPFGKSMAEAWAPNSFPNQENAEQSNEGMGANSSTDRSAGWVLIQGNPQARAGGTVTISGARPGVDGPWLMSEVEHIYSRESGYVTRCILAQFGAPGGENIPEVPSGRGYGEGY